MQYFHDREGRLRKGRELGATEYAEHKMMERATTRCKETEAGTVEAERSGADQVQAREPSMNPSNTRPLLAQSAGRALETITRLKNEFESRSMLNLEGHVLAFVQHP